MKAKYFFQLLIITCSAFFISSVNAMNTVEKEAFCLGAMSKALENGAKASEFPTATILNVKRIADKYKGLESQWSSTAESCLVVGSKGTGVFKCLETKIEDETAVYFYKGFFVSRSAFSSKPIGAARDEINSFCTNFKY
jgi:hypothetical protein